MASRNPEALKYCANFTKVACDIKGIDGIAFDQDGYLYATDPLHQENGKPAGRIWKIDLVSLEKTLICSPKDGAYGGMPNAIKFDGRGDLWLADMRLGLVRIFSNGKSKQIAKRDYSFNPMQGCKDLCIDFSGHVWISAAGNNIAPDSNIATVKEMWKEGNGCLYCYLPEDERVIKIESGLKLPCGISIQQDKNGQQCNLLLAECGTKSIWSYDITDPGVIENKKLWAKVLGQHFHGYGPTGIATDCQGNLLVCNFGSSYIEVFSKFGGRPIARIQCPFKNVCNITFKPNSKEVFVSDQDTDSLWKFEWKHSGVEI